MRNMDGAQGTAQTPLNRNQASLPYKVNRDGAFRPPILSPRELLPLSRLPRVNTHQQANPGSDRTVVNKLLSCSTDLREVRQNLLRVCAAPKALFNIETPQTEPSQVKKVIQDKLQGHIRINKGEVRHPRGKNPHPDRGVKSHVKYSKVNPNPSLNIHSKATVRTNEKMPIQERLKGACRTNKSGNELQSYIHKQKTQKRNLPQRAFTVNPWQRGVDLNGSLSSREYKHLPERRARGGFTNSGYQQTSLREEVLPRKVIKTK
jgi:hypothetical protein